MNNTDTTTVTQDHEGWVHIASPILELKYPTLALSQTSYHFLTLVSDKTSQFSEDQSLWFSS